MYNVKEMLPLSKISLCMIAKNEESNIERCLASVRSFVDEMIVVDTGSTDRTVSLCELAGAQVYHFEWNNNFADARNYSLSQATGDWILWMDADEVLEVTEGADWKTRLAEETAPVLNVHLINYIGDKIDLNETYHIAHTRLFRNHIGLCFLYSIHETLNVEQLFINENALTELKQIQGLTIYHYGYLQEYVSAKQKSDRNLLMLLDELKVKDRNPWTEYHLASEYYRIENFEKAYEFVNLSISRFINKQKLPPSLLYKLKYSCLISLGRTENIPAGIDKAVMLYPDYVDLFFFKGVALYLNKRYNSALQVFDQCLTMGEDNIQHLTLKGAGSFHAFYYKGLCYEKTNKHKFAVEAFTEALRLNPNYEHAIEGLTRLNVSMQ